MFLVIYESNITSSNIVIPNKPRKGISGTLFESQNNELLHKETQLDLTVS